MNNEDTRLLNEDFENNQKESNIPELSEKPKTGMPNKAKVAVAGAAGMAAGTVVGAGAVGVAVAANHDNADPVAEESEVENASEENDNVIVADAESEETDGVSENLESHTVHHVTNNYTYNEIHTHTEPMSAQSQMEHPEGYAATPVNGTIIAEPVDDEVRIIGVETVHHPEGFDMDVVALAQGDDQALLVDVDQNGTLDVFIHDDNYNGELEPSEFHDISQEGITMNDLGIDMHHEDYYMTSDDGMPDYLNDADSVMEI